MRSFHNLVIVLMYGLSQIDSYGAHSLKQTSWDVSAGFKSNYLQKEVKGATSGEYLMAKYRPFIEGAVMSVKHATDVNHENISAQQM